jgi:hypothetical protein
MRTSPPLQRAVPLALVSRERRIDVVKGNSPDLDQLDDRDGTAIGTSHDTDIADFW